MADEGAGLEISAIEAVEWREPAPGGGSQAQVFRLADNRYALVKFPENGQGQLVLANEFLCCQLAEFLGLPVNQAVRVIIDERIIQEPRSTGQMPSNFTAGLRCGMIRFENSQGATEQDVQHCSNSAELHHVVVFEQLVNRQDGRQLLTYPAPEGGQERKFAAYDYGYAFGGDGNWTTAQLQGIAAPVLPTQNPLTGQPYDGNGAPFAALIAKLRALDVAKLQDIIGQLHPPRWGLEVAAVAPLVNFLDGRARSLVEQFDQRYQAPQLEGL